MGKIRGFCKANGFEVEGRLSYMGMWDHCNRWYMDEAQTAYLLDTVMGTIRIIRPHRKEIRRSTP